MDSTTFGSCDVDPTPSPVESPIESPTDLWESIFVNDFEEDQGIFQGNDKRFEGISASPGAWSLRVRKESTLRTSRVDVSNYSELSLTFMLQGKGMEVREGFYLETKFGEGEFVQVKEWVRGTDFDNNEWVEATVDIPTNGKKNVVLRFK